MDVWTPWETLQLSPHPLPKHGMGLKQGYSHSTLPKKYNKMAGLTLASEGSGSLAKPH